MYRQPPTLGSAISITPPVSVHRLLYSYNQVQLFGNYCFFALDYYTVALFLSWGRRPPLNLWMKKTEPYLEHVVNHDQNILNRLILGHVFQQVEEGFRALSPFVCQQRLTSSRVRTIKRRDEVEVIVGNHLAPGNGQSVSNWQLNLQKQCIAFWRLKLPRNYKIDSLKL